MMLRMVTRIHFVIVVCLCLLLFGFGGATISNQRDVGAGPATAPQTVYVTDFDLEARDMQPERGPLSPLRQQRERLGASCLNRQALRDLLLRRSSTGHAVVCV